MIYGILFIVVLLQGIQSSVICPNGFDNWYGDKCYRISDTNNHWTEKRNDCLALGADLMSIHSSEENLALRALRTNDYWHGIYWSGLSCDSTNNPFWTDGTPVDYVNTDFSCSSTSQAYMWAGNETLWKLTAVNGVGRYSICVLTVPHECGIGYELVDGSTTCVKMSALTVTWTEAEAICAQDGAHLASIHSRRMNDYIRRLALSHNFVEGVFIGMQLVDHSAVAWSDQTVFDYANFDTGMPNWMFGECGALQTHDLLGRWTSMNCDSIDKLPFVCSRPITCPDSNTFEVQGEFFSPQHPHSIVTGLSCEYFLAATPGTIVSLRFLEISLQPGDSVTLYDGLANDKPIAVVTTAEEGDRFLTKESNIMKVVHLTSTVRGERSWHASFMST